MRLQKQLYPIRRSRWLRRMKNLCVVEKAQRCHGKFDAAPELGYPDGEISKTVCRDDDRGQ
jgi:hypothetical protein